MVESYAFIFAGTISLNPREARAENLQVPGPHTACTTDIGLMSEGGYK